MLIVVSISLSVLAEFNHYDDAEIAKRMENACSERTPSSDIIRSWKFWEQDPQERDEERIVT